VTDPSATPPAVLVVDDNGAQRAALTVVLAELGVPVVEADSGRDALRHLLRQPFAVILLDVNMPGLDGFETARLIRQRPSSEHTPIIFVTAHEDDTYAVRGYSLGAVDYILSPVQPDVLRAKVSVFIDLYRNAEEIRFQRRTLERYATQLRQLSEASLAIYSASGFGDVLSVVADNAARIIGARQASVSAVAPHSGRVTTVALAAAQNGSRPSRSVRTSDDLTALRLEQPARLPTGATADGFVPTELVRGRPLRGWMAVPLVARDGRALGVVQLSDKVDGDFSADDEDLLLQLARMASTTLDNALAAEAREANRLKDEFLGVLSHELRTPLQAIFAWVDILRQRPSDVALLAQAADVVERSAQAQMRLIGDLLDVSRIARGQLQLERDSVELAAVVRLALDTVRPMAAAKHIAISFGAAAEDCWVDGDATRLQQVVWNLFSNAVKFTPEGGRVEVSLAAAANQLQLRVQDSGPGIPAAFLPHVFERFRQADSSAARPHGGLGLGLAIVRHLVELHGGEVAAENAAGGGAAFTIRLPRAWSRGAQGQPTGAIAAPRAPTRLDGIRVLLVEDEIDSRDALSEVLQCFGAEVEAVGSAAAALRIVQQRVPDILVSDVGLPGEDGYALIQQLRAWEGSGGSGLPAVALTAYARLEDRVAALRSGFDAHVHKPVEPLQLAQLVKQLARRV
jgi:signal transduction histidine kinase/DNA-binding response OmpR family regulator